MPTHRKARPDRDLPTPADLIIRMRRVLADIDKCAGELMFRAEKYPEAEHAYRQAKSAAQLKAPTELEAEGFERPTVDEKAAYVVRETAEKRLQAQIHKSMKDAAREVIRAREAQLSALQSMAAAVRSEMEIAGKGPR